METVGEQQCTSDDLESETQFIRLSILRETQSVESDMQVFSYPVSYCTVQERLTQLSVYVRTVPYYHALSGGEGIDGWTDTSSTVQCSVLLQPVCYTLILHDLVQVPSLLIAAVVASHRSPMRCSAV